MTGRSTRIRSTRPPTRLASLTLLIVALASSSGAVAQENGARFPELESWLQDGSAPRALQVVPLRREPRFPEPRLFHAGTIGSILPEPFGPRHRIPLGPATAWLRKVTTDTVLAQKGWSVDDRLDDCLGAALAGLPEGFGRLRWREIRDGTLSLAIPYAWELQANESPRPLREILASNIHLRTEDPWNYGPRPSAEGTAAILQWALEQATGSDWSTLIAKEMTTRLRLGSLRGEHARFRSDDGERGLEVPGCGNAREVAAFHDASLALGDFAEFVRQWIRTEPLVRLRRSVLDVDLIDSDFGHLRLVQIPAAGLAVAVVDPEQRTLEAIEALLVDLGLAERPAPREDGWNSTVRLGGGAGGRFPSTPTRSTRERRGLLRISGRFEAGFRTLDGEHRLVLEFPSSLDDDVSIELDGQGRPPGRLVWPDTVGGLARLRTRPEIEFHEWRGRLRGFAVEERSSPRRTLAWSVPFQRVEPVEEPSDTRWLGGSELASRIGIGDRMALGAPTGAARLVAISQMDDTWFGSSGLVGIDDGEAFDHTMTFPLGSLSRVLGFLADETLANRHPSRLFWQRGVDGLAGEESDPMMETPWLSIGRHRFLSGSTGAFATLTSRMTDTEAGRSAIEIVRRHTARSTADAEVGRSDLGVAFKQAIYESSNCYQSVDAFLAKDLAPRFSLGPLLLGDAAAEALQDFRVRGPDGRPARPTLSELPFARGLATDAATLVRATRCLFDGSLPAWSPSHAREFGFRSLGPDTNTQATVFWLRDDDPNTTRRVLFCHELDLVVVLFAAEPAEDWADAIETELLDQLLPAHALPSHQEEPVSMLLPPDAPVRPIGRYEGEITIDGIDTPVSLDLRSGARMVNLEVGDSRAEMRVAGSGLTRVRLEGEVPGIGTSVLDIERLRFSERLRATLTLVNERGGRWPISIRLRSSR